MAEMTGLDIGSHFIKLVSLRMISQAPVLTHAGIKEIPYGGKKEDLNFVSEIVKSLYREVALKPGKVRLTVSGSGVHIVRITIPFMPKGELKEALRWEIKGHLPVSIESVEIDFHILREFVEKGVKKLDVIAVACPHHLIDRVLSIARGAGLKPTHIDVAAFAFWNVLLAFDGLGKEEVVALVDLGAEKTSIHLFKDRILQFSREITPAGADISRAIMEGIESEEEPHLLYERAERIKKEMGIPSQTSYEGINNKTVNWSKIPFLVRPVLERLAAEIKRSLDYYRDQFHVERIDRLLLTGGGANLKNITAYLADELRLSVKEFCPFRDLHYDPKKIDEQAVQNLDRLSPILTIATGLSLPALKRIELLPPQEPFWSRVRMDKWIPVVSPLITLLVFSWIFSDMSTREAPIRKERDLKVEKVKTLEMLQSKLKLLKEKEIQMKEDLSLFPSSMIVSLPFPEVMGTISDIVPENITLTLLSVQPKAKPAKRELANNGRGELKINGLAFGSNWECLTALAQIIERLEKFPLFKNAKLVSAVENKLYNRPGTSFEIICDIGLNNQKREGKP